MLAEQIGTDGLQLLQLIDMQKDWPWLCEIPAVQILRRVWIQQFYASDPGSAVRWRAAEDLPPAPLLISSPYDPDARWSKKRETSWTGYKVHLLISVWQSPSGCLFSFSIFFVLSLSAFAAEATWSGSFRHRSTVSSERICALLYLERFLHYL